MLPLMVGVTYWQPKLETNPSMQMIDRVKKKMIWIESGHRHTWKNGEVKISKKCAIGERQLMPFIAYEYNRKIGASVTTNDLYKRSINRKIGDWFFMDLISMRDGNYFLAVNDYKMGVNNTDRGKYDFYYLNAICPSEFKFWRKSVKIVKKSSEGVYYVEPVK